jgi:phosphate uptake regulator
MYRRKIQSVGGGTYTVSLPKEWADARGISTGDAVDLHTHVDGVLAVQASESETDRAVRVDLSDGASVERTLRAAYAAGAKEVRLDAPGGFDAEQRAALDSVTRNLTGVSVVEGSDTTVRVRILLDTGEVSIRQSVRQLAFVALSMHRDATAALSTDAERPAGRDDQADRLYAMVDRSFARALARLDEVDSLGLTRPELFDLWATARELERVADHAERIAAANLSDGAALDETREAAADARAIVEDAVSVVVGDAPAETARATLDERDTVRDRIGALDARHDGELRPVLDRLRRTAEHGGNIAELGLRGALRDGDPFGELRSLDQNSRPPTSD